MDSEVLLDAWCISIDRRMRHLKSRIKKQEEWQAKLASGCMQYWYNKAIIDTSKSELKFLEKLMEERTDE